MATSLNPLLLFTRVQDSPPFDVLKIPPVPPVAVANTVIESPG
jgi:hypothetical protein